MGKKDDLNKHQAYYNNISEPLQYLLNVPMLEHTNKLETLQTKTQHSAMASTLI